MTDNKAHKGNIEIGEGVSITGTIQVPGKAFINGILNGELSADELVVGQHGKLTGQVTVNKAEIHGETHESLVAREHLTLRASGKIHGKVAYGQIEIARGGQIAGTVGPVPVGNGTTGGRPSNPVLLTELTDMHPRLPDPAATIAG
jgi:cytoskeletal protein CcmA (bactofilin family)